MSPPALIVLEDGLTNKWSNDEWQRLSVFPGENPNPTFNFLVKNQLTVSPVLSRPSVKDESFRMVLPLAMSPPRDNAVPLPVLPEPMMKPRKKLGTQESMLSVGKARYPVKKFIHEDEEEFKCNAFCLSLPGFMKQKHVRSPKSSDDSSVKKKKMTKASSFSNSTISLGDSFEKFECGSWASTTTALARENNRLYFDLPVEMIKCGRGSGGDVQEPMSLGFFFDKERESLPLRSVLKTSRSERQQRGCSAETSPHRRVRFSTTTSVSCPTSPRSCITPRLLKARDDFNTFLAAQNA
ncbi:hypothetical protein BRARA_E00940 [Brassica rapa]|uniref:BnaA05g08980D protein n=3 Tax=Brassica TaxID=3705 RepID=A0A078H2L1_BRANA|nr:uncharacterized protein LOC103867407 [Brassica rapa]XP_048629218.1 uncharacterized protein LOC125600631 [Brassica napus]KAH0851187.1 hypothetical protein HID58_091109 [Brassica napus]RID61826.1 hypothetical protein BRARA_E00940 [Brassica rapa]CAF2095521.1 unnamed protein product [Brassica napus]CAG7874574.1 unnamed protein product [Brassica rapa]CDY31649.1 BnaA05g08980D [Brassica napus]